MRGAKMPVSVIAFVPSCSPVSGSTVFCRKLGVAQALLLVAERRR